MENSGLQKQFYLAYAQKAFSVVLNNFPIKLKEIDSLKKEFDWNQIVTTKANIDWVKAFIEKNFSANKTQIAGLTDNCATLTNHHCIAYSNMKPILFDAIDRSAYDPKSTNGAAMIETNRCVHQMIGCIKPYLIELTEQALQLSFAIQLLEPKFQEGNNFGLEVQNKTLHTITDAYSSAQDFLESLKSYYCRRDRLLKCVMCYPHIEDFRVNLTELDRSFVYTLCCCAEELYSIYTATHDIIVKNIDKLLRPRGEEENDVVTQGTSKTTKSAGATP